jgi:hypothetical protein
LKLAAEIAGIGVCNIEEDLCNVWTTNKMHLNEVNFLPATFDFMPAKTFIQFGGSVSENSN